MNKYFGYCYTKGIKIAKQIERQISCNEYFDKEPVEEEDPKRGYTLKMEIVNANETFYPICTQAIADIKGRVSLSILHKFGIELINFCFLISEKVLLRNSIVSKWRIETTPYIFCTDRKSLCNFVLQKVVRYLKSAWK